MQAKIDREPVPPPPATVTITMTEDEARDLSWLAGYCATAAQAIHEHTQLHARVPMTDRQRHATKAAGSALYYALRDAGVRTP